MRKASELLSFNIRPEMSCSGYEEQFQALHSFFNSSQAQSRSFAAQSHSGLDGRSDELFAAGFDFSTSARSIPLLFKNDHESSNTKIDRRAISGLSERLSFLMKQQEKQFEFG